MNAITKDSVFWKRVLNVHLGELREIQVTATWMHSQYQWKTISIWKGEILLFPKIYFLCPIIPTGSEYLCDQLTDCRPLIL